MVALGSTEFALVSAEFALASAKHNIGALASIHQNSLLR